MVVETAEQQVRVASGGAVVPLLLSSFARPSQSCAPICQCQRGKSAMVRMFPSYGPVKETTSDAERKVYSALQRGLSDGYFVYHGVTWQYKDTDGRLRDGEVDFVIVHQNIGLLLLEVKGGKVECDGADDWYSVDRTGERHSIKNPFHQVRVAYHILQRHLEQTRPTSNYASEYRFATGVWFPDMRWRRGRLSHPLLRDEQVLDLADLENPIQGVRRLVRFCEPDSD